MLTVPGAPVPGRQLPCIASEADGPSRSLPQPCPAPLSRFPMPSPQDLLAALPGAGLGFLPLQDWASGLLLAPAAPQLGLPPATCHPPTWTPLCPCWRRVGFGRL